MLYIGLILGSLVVAICATHLRGLTIPHYLLYMLGQGIATVLFLYCNKEMSPFSYAVGVTALIILIATLIAWVKGVPVSIEGICGVVFIIVGTILVMK